MNDSKRKSKILFFAGSTRKASVNKMLARTAFEIAKNTEAEALLIDLKDYILPLYDGDLEEAQGLPENAIKLKQIFIDHDSIFIASPEYNSSITPLLKNTLDWISRSSDKNEAPNRAYQGKIIALGSASPSYLGGQRSLIPLQMMLSNVGATVLSKKISIQNAYTKFNEEGLLIDSDNYQALTGVVNELVRTTNAIQQSGVQINN